MDQVNDFTKIIHNTYKNTGITKDSIYDEILKREEDIKQVINRVIDYEKDKENNALFVNTKFSDILVNIFKILNDLLDDLTNINKMSFKKFKSALFPRTKDKAPKIIDFPAPVSPVIEVRPESKETSIKSIIAKFEIESLFSKMKIYIIKS